MTETYLPPAFFVRGLERTRNGLERLRKRLFPPALSTLELVTGYWISQAVITGTRLGLAEELKQSPLSTLVLAERLRLHEPTLYRLLRTLAAYGVFRELKGRRFAHTTLSRPLTADHPSSIRGMVLMLGEPWHWDAFMHMDESVRTGKPAFELRQGIDLFSFLGKNPEAAKNFNEAMTGWTAQSAVAVAKAFDFSKFKILADIGGGHGQLLSTILKQNTGLKGILFDSAAVIENARQRFFADGVEARCVFQSGDFFSSLPAGADSHVLRNILHDWDDARCEKILRGCRQALPKTGRLLLVEAVIPEGNTFHVGKLTDLEMMVCTPGGKERTEKEFRALLKASGFHLENIHQTSALESVIEATPI